MAIGNEGPTIKLETTMAGEAQRHWGWILAIGIAFVVLGLIGLGMTFAVTVASVLMYGILLLLGAGAQVVQAAKGRAWKGIVLHVLIALLYLVAGIAVIVNPVGASAILTLMLAGVLIVVGFVRIIMALQLRGFRNWFWPLAGGVVSIILGGMITASWPVSGLWVIGLFVSVELMVNGWSYIFISLAARNP
ncbi:MAG: HdeD family acid-resistance protein [Desulfomonile tiedjei]|nr:HdeD family acid-resistance protein [Desulfomonile tiedjei]